MRSQSTPRKRIDILNDRGQAMVEFLVVMPVLVLLLFGIIEMGAAFRTYQVVTNTAREGARVAVLPSADPAEVQDAVRARLDMGGLDPDLVVINLLCDAGIDGACFGGDRTGLSTEVRVSYPHTFTLLGPVVSYMGGNTDNFGTVTLQTAIVMRNE